MAFTKDILSQSAHELKQMRRDLNSMLADRGLDWNAPRPVPKTLDEATPITPWRFACHFLSQFHEWRLAVNRWVRLFGAELPKRWQRNLDLCPHVVERIANHPGFHDALTVSLVAARLLPEDPGLMPVPREIGISFEPSLGVETAFDQLMDLNQIESLAAILRAGENPDLLPALAAARDRRRAAVQQQLLDLHPANVLILEHHLCCYRNAMLQSRVLQPDGKNFWPTHILLDQTLLMKLSDTLQPYIGTLNLNLDTELKSILDTLGGLITEIGYSGLCEQLTSGDFQSLPGAGTQRHYLNVIPGAGGASCAGVVLTLLRVAGQSKPHENFRRIMTQLKAHLVHCQGRTKTVILLTDWWDSVVFEEEHQAELSAWRGKGVQFILLLVTQPGSMITPVQLRL